MTRDEYIVAARQLLAEGDRLQANPSLAALQVWLKLSDDTLSAAWGAMDRYHLAWLTVGKSRQIVRGRRLTPDEEHAYVREVASQKASVVAMSLDAVERQGMPFVGESGGVAPGQGMGTLPELSDRLADARRAAAEHRDHPDRPGPSDGEGPRRAPRPERMER
ncbi:MAG: hypothetical protein AABZ33_01235 [Chloroflexota bacterium]